LTIGLEERGHQPKGNPRNQASPSQTTPPLPLVDDDTIRPKNLQPSETRPPHPTAIQIFAKTSDGKTLTLPTHSTASITNIKRLLYNKSGTPPTHGRLIFAGKQLEDSHTLADYNIGNEATLHQLLRLYGGADKDSYVIHQLRNRKREALQKEEKAKAKEARDSAGFEKADEQQQHTLRGDQLFALEFVLQSYKILNIS